MQFLHNKASQSDRLTAVARVMIYWEIGILSEFKAITERLVREIQAAYMHYDLHCNLKRQLVDHGGKMNDAKHFWSLTLNAHLDAARSSLARVYDQHKKSLGLKAYISEFRDSIKTPFHSTDEVSERYFCAPLAESEIENDLELISENNVLVGTFIKRHRHTEIAHISLTNAKRSVSAFEADPISYAETQELIDRAVRIINRYSVLSDGCVYGVTTLDNDDYMQLFRE